MRKTILLILLSTVVLITSSCIQKRDDLRQETDFIVNTSHLDSLYEEITIVDQTISQTPSPIRVGIIHIYSEYPDYKWVGDSDEGIACVDDAARAAVFYLNKYESYGYKSSLEKAKMLLEFIM